MQENLLNLLFLPFPVILSKLKTSWCSTFGTFLGGLYTYLYLIGILIGKVIFGALRSLNFIIDVFSYFSGYDIFNFSFLAGF